MTFFTVATILPRYGVSIVYYTRRIPMTQQDRVAEGFRTLISEARVEQFRMNRDFVDCKTTVYFEVRSKEIAVELRDEIKNLINFGLTQETT